MNVSVTDAIAAIERPVAKPAIQRQALLIGNIGDLGEKLLNHLLSTSEYSHVRVAARAPLRSAHAKLIVEPLGDASPSAWQWSGEVRDVLCCISGKENWHKRDQAYVPVRAEEVAAIALAARRMNTQRFLLVSPMTAWQQLSAVDAAAFGEVELALQQHSLPATVVLRPSRDEDGEAGETLLSRFAAGWLSVLKGYLAPQSFQHLRSDLIAKAAVHFLTTAEPGFRVVGARDIHQWAHPGAGPRRGF
ncbi:MAG: hypothetical protein JNM76_05670 [Betaproteobacteria bacterium]|nr:hypothetical protein [Betaproteobacteria bacterium]